MASYFNEDYCCSRTCIVLCRRCACLGLAERDTVPHPALWALKAESQSQGSYIADEDALETAKVCTVTEFHIPGSM